MTTRCCDAGLQLALKQPLADVGQPVVPAPLGVVPARRPVGLLLWTMTILLVLLDQSAARPESTETLLSEEWSRLPM